MGEQDKKISNPPKKIKSQKKSVKKKGCGCGKRKPKSS